MNDDKITVNREVYDNLLKFRFETGELLSKIHIRIYLEDDVPKAIRNWWDGQYDLRNRMDMLREEIRRG